MRRRGGSVQKGKGVQEGKEEKRGKKNTYVVLIMPCKPDKIQTMAPRQYLPRKIIIIICRLWGKQEGKWERRER